MLFPNPSPEPHRMAEVHADDYRPPRWLRDAHVQSVLSSSPWRRRRGRALFAATGAVTCELILPGGDGVRLQGFHSRVPNRAPRGLAVLFHGWEGSSESGYLLHTAARLLADGFEVFRLNFRDHGDTHHLNQDIFHSCRLAEVVHAVKALGERFAPLPLVAAGYSLGGNFALRLARAAPAAGIRLRHAAAVCPVIDPAAGMDALERGLPLYHWYFARKWRRSLEKKRRLFAAHRDLDDRILSLGIRELTAHLVRRGGEFPSLEAYFDGYSVAGDRLADLQVPVSILTAADDPVIPVHGFHGLRLPAHSRLEISPWGGHCGFIEGLDLRGFGERWVAARLSAALAAAPERGGRATIDGSFTAS